MKTRLTPLLAPALVAALALSLVASLALAEPSSARATKPTVAVINATSDYLIGGVVDGRWADADTLQARLPESAPVRSLSLSGERSLGAKVLKATQPPDICNWNWQYGDLGGGDHRPRA